MRRVGWGLVLGIFCVFTMLNWSVAAGYKVAIVDMQKALNLSKAGKAAKAKLQKKFNKMKADLDARQKELEKLKQELEKQSLMLSLDAKQDKEREYKRKLRDFQDLYQDYKQEMTRAEYEAIQPILRGLQQAAEQIRKKEGYLIVFEKNNAGIVCYEHGIDITDKVVKLYDQQWKKRQKKAK